MGQKNFIIDTNVLLENPRCLHNFRNGNENRIILPYTVLEELDKLKKNHRLSHLVTQIVKEIESDKDIIFLDPHGHEPRGVTNDDKIIYEIVHSQLDAPILVTNDRLMQIKARLHNIVSEYYRDSHPYQSESQTYTRYVFDLLLKLHEKRPANRIFQDPENKNKLNAKRFQILPLAYIRGMNIEDAVVIIDITPELLSADCYLTPAYKKLCMNWR